MVGGASLLPISIFRPSWAPAELPSVKHPGSWCAEVDEEAVASGRGVVADLRVADVDVGNLAFNSNGAAGIGSKDPVPREVKVELPISAGEE